MIPVLAQASNDDSSGALAILFILGFLALAVLALVGYWKVFVKIGLPGWMGIVPFVNIYMLFKARGQRSPGLWLVLSLIPIVNIVAAWFLASDTAELFDKELGWKLFLFFIPGISHIVLGFGEAQVNPTRVAAEVAAR